MSGWVTESVDGVWVFRHPDGRRIEALANDKVRHPNNTRHAIVDALDALDEFMR